MKKILIVGAGGQIGSELVPHLRSIYGNNNVVAADISAEKCKVLAEAGPFEELNALDGEKKPVLTCGRDLMETGAAAST